MRVTIFILALAVLAGQTVKIPVTPNSGITLLDLSVILLSLFGLVRLRFKVKNISLPFKLFLIFTFWGALTLIISNLGLSPTQILNSISYDLRLFFFILLGIVLQNNGLKTLLRFSQDLFFYTGALLSLLGLLQLIFIPNLGFLTQSGWDPHYFRTVSTFLDPNFLGGFLSLTLLLGFKKLETGSKNNLIKILFSLNYLSLITTFSKIARPSS